MSNSSINFIIWVLFIGALAFLGFFLGRTMNRNRKIKMEKKAEYDDMRATYEDLTEEKFDSCKNEDLPSAVIFSCMKKEDQDEDYFKTLTEPEKTVYGIYQLNECISGSSGLRSFFLTPALEEYVPVIDKLYENIGAHDIAELIKAARHLNEILESGKEDDEDTGEFSTYNFSDFTHEYITMVAGTNFNQKMIDYVKKNKASFIMKEDKKTKE